MIVETFEEYWTLLQGTKLLLDESAARWAYNHARKEKHRLRIADGRFVGVQHMETCPVGVDPGTWAVEQRTGSGLVD